MERAPSTAKEALQRVVGKGVDAVKVQTEPVPALKGRKRGQFVKGSPEAKEWGRIMAEKRKQKKMVGGKDSLPKESMQGSGVKEDIEMYNKIHYF